ncbi:MAG: SDR family NAD(P)-dependent oxidoreductase [Deltaproteobacteria bacterium]|nr:SDR family NAD(P)-dependent oxidoreductase [Deltaproteobacteria bacterium]
MKNLRGKLAVVTGASSGIGRATALALADRGCDLALADVNEAGLAETAKLVASSGSKVSRHLVDVARKDLMELFAAEVARTHGRVNIVINNAGVSVTAPFEKHTLEDFEWIVGINFWGVVYGCKFFLPHLKAAGEGHIVNISSVFGLIGLPSQSSYAATKFAVRGFSESLRAELTGQNIGVTCVHPGGINTNIVKSARFSEEMAQQMRVKAVKFFETKALPPSSVANAIVRGIRNNEARVLVARETFAIDLVKRVFPVWASELVGRNRDRFMGK